MQIVRETICMKFHAYFVEKVRMKIINLSSAEFAHWVVMVKYRFKNENIFWLDRKFKRMIEVLYKMKILFWLDWN